jgi:hypothetical protein
MTNPVVRKVSRPVSSILIFLDYVGSDSGKCHFNNHFGLDLLANCNEDDELSSCPGNVDVMSMSILMLMSIVLVYKQKTGNGRHGKSKSNLPFELIISSITEKKSSTRNRTIPMLLCRSF